MVFLPETTGYLHLFPPVCPGPQLMPSWPPRANSQTPRQPGTVPMAVGHKGQENACLLPMSCPHWASGGMQYVHTLKDDSKSSTVHNSSLALSQDQNHSGDVRKQPATWSQGCSSYSGFGRHSRMATLSRTVSARQFYSVSVLACFHRCFTPPTSWHSHRPMLLSHTRAFMVKCAPYRANTVFTDIPQCASDQADTTL